MFSAEIELVFCRERPACRSVNVGYVWTNKVRQNQFNHNNFTFNYRMFSERHIGRSLQNLICALNINLSVFVISTKRNPVSRQHRVLWCDGYVRTYYITCKSKSQRGVVQTPSGMRGTMSRPLYCADLLPPPAGGRRGGYSATKMKG